MSSNSPSALTIYTDGSSSPGGRGPGGWAFVAAEDGKEIFSLRGGELDTTNNRMEMQAIIEAMRWAAGRPCDIHSDSQLCVNTLTTWALGWRKRGWRKADGSRPMNLDLVVEAFGLYRYSGYRLRWVRGHAGNVFNERADQLAGLARKAQGEGQ